MTWNDNEPIINIEDVHKSFDQLEVLRGISMQVANSEVLCIIGPSGSGKSTLLRCINALVPVTSGGGIVGGPPVGVKGPSSAVDEDLVVEVRPGSYRLSMCAAPRQMMGEGGWTVPVARRARLRKPHVRRGTGSARWYVCYTR